MKFFIRLAGYVIEIHSIYVNVKNQAKDYLVNEEKPDIVIETTQADIDAEVREVDEGTRPRTLETLAVYRKITEAMLQYDILLMHGTVIAVNGKAFLFAAPSGTGKTTHGKLWLENLSEAFVVNGDKPLITTKGVPMACGTPWAGKEKMQTNTMVPLAAIIFMERSENNEIHPITFSEAFSSLLRQTYHPRDKDKLIKTIRLLKSLDHRVKFYSFHFNNFKDAFQVAYHELVEKEQEAQSSPYSEQNT